MKMESFFRKHPVFRLDELDQFLAAFGQVKPRARESLLAYHKKRGRIQLIKRGVFAVIPLDADPISFPVDHFILASKLAPDAVLAYHTALEAHGYAHSVIQVYSYLTSRTVSLFSFRNTMFRGIRYPASLTKQGKTNFEVVALDRVGLKIPITGLDRTFVDVLDRPDLSGGWEEIWRSLESIDYLNIEKVIEYVMILKNATVAAKVGFFLEKHRERLLVDEKYFQHLRKYRPKQPHYLNRRKRKGGLLVADWNLVVPEEILNRTWEELS